MLVCGLALQVGGCDSSASKRTSQYSSLVGTWRILRVDTNIGRYPLQDTVQVEFLPGEDRGRYYRLLRPSQRNPVVAEGGVDMPEAGVLSMTEGFPGPLLWTFDFDRPNDLTTSVRFFLQSRWDGSSQAFLNAIGRSGSARVIEMDLERESD
jgi:hypothetical protein